MKAVKMVSELATVRPELLLLLADVCGAVLGCREHYS
jgi:hypothetical protein